MNPGLQRRPGITIERLTGVFLLVTSMLLVAGPAGAHSRAGATMHAVGVSPSYSQTNLVSDVPGMATVTDPNLVNPWGIAFAPTSPFWISDNGTGVSTLYNTAGQPLSLVVTIPASPSNPSGTTGTPTGIVFNGTPGFVVTERRKAGSSLFIFATEDGTISGWSPAVDVTHAILKVDNAPNAVYKGLAMGSFNGNNYLFATNFRTGTVDVFNQAFKPVRLRGGFHDSNIPPGYAPFGIANLGGNIYVTYAQQNDARHDDVAGPGHGFLAVFTTGGFLIRDLVSGGVLNSPWGLALAPAGQGSASNMLLVGNFGDGHITIVDPQSGAVLGQLSDTHGAPLAISGLWGLIFGNGARGGDPNTLYFTAGINHEQDGLFGSLSRVSG